MKWKREYFVLVALLLLVIASGLVRFPQSIVGEQEGFSVTAISQVTVNGEDAILVHATAGGSGSLTITQEMVLQEAGLIIDRDIRLEAGPLAQEIRKSISQQVQYGRHWRCDQNRQGEMTGGISAYNAIEFRQVSPSPVFWWEQNFTLDGRQQFQLSSEATSREAEGIIATWVGNDLGAQGAGETSNLIVARPLGQDSLYLKPRGVSENFIYAPQPTYWQNPNQAGRDLNCASPGGGPHSTSEGNSRWYDQYWAPYLQNELQEDDLCPQRLRQGQTPYYFCEPRQPVISPEYTFLFTRASGIGINRPRGMPEITDVSSGELQPGGSQQINISGFNRGDADTFVAELSCPRVDASFRASEYAVDGNSAFLIAAEVSGVSGVIQNCQVTVSSKNYPDNADSEQLRLIILPFCDTPEEAGKARIYTQDLGCVDICDGQYSDDLIHETCASLSEREIVDQGVQLTPDEQNLKHCMGVGRVEGLSRYANDAYVHGATPFVPEERAGQVFVPYVKNILGQPTYTCDYHPLYSAYEGDYFGFIRQAPREAEFAQEPEQNLEELPVEQEQPQEAENLEQEVLPAQKENIQPQSVNSSLLLLAGIGVCLYLVFGWRKK